MLHERLYQNQIQHTLANSTINPSIIFSPDTVDAWRHQRMYDYLSPIVQTLPHASWLTVGDTGADAFWLRARGVADVTASSIDLKQIAYIKDEGFLDGVEISTINAENINLCDSTVDFVCCKEAYHHFPRAPIGLYEMLRVCRIGIVLIAEPNGEPQTRLLDRARRALKKLLRKNTAFSNPDFENSGNFIFGVSLNEFRKMATAIQLNSIYYSFDSDFYHGRLNGRKFSEKIPSLLSRLGIYVQHILSSIGIMSWGRISLVVFKEEPSRELHAALISAGNRRISIPVNPYL